ncbi:O-methyltransferase [Fodinicola feengrottensis]|uniref:SAM-dependent O-methyltransferase n=1 Tax=Fodinicola feengrottensis TaxID=435914 RepID=A0ABN2IJI7_9ACTN|nr:O-methyltransferase [Fodinicola feengrottensis]
MQSVTTIADSIDFVEGFVGEDAVLGAARGRAAEVGCRAVGPGAGATLRLFATTVAARAVVEVGTGTGVSGLWLLRSLAVGGVLTSIDTESEHQQLARQTFADAGIPPGRFRLINGRATEVLPRLADSSYDMVFVDADPTSYPEYLNQALRLLRAGGVLAINNALADGRTADVGARDVEAVAMRGIAAAVRDDDRLAAALLPVGDGLLVATLGHRA